VETLQNIFPLHFVAGPPTPTQGPPPPPTPGSSQPPDTLVSFGFGEGTPLYDVSRGSHGYGFP